MNKHFAKITAALTSLVAVLYLQANNAYAALGVQSGANAARGNDQPIDLFGVGGTFSTITNVLLFIVGAIAVIMIVIGGLRYVTSGGNQNAVTAAKNTILYAIIGIIVAILAYAAINFVLGSLLPGDGSGTNV